MKKKTKSKQQPYEVTITTPSMVRAASGAIYHNQQEVFCNRIYELLPSLSTRGDLTMITASRKEAFGSVGVFVKLALQSNGKAAPYFTYFSINGAHWLPMYAFWTPYLKRLGVKPGRPVKLWLSC